MVDPCVNGSEDGEKTSPRVVPPIEHLGTVPIRFFGEPPPQRGYGITLVVDGIAGKQESTFLGAQNEHQRIMTVKPAS